MNNLEKILAILLLIFAIGFNLWLYRLEPSSLVDPNDNAFQFALVDRTNQIWDFANKNCPKKLSFVICHLSFLTDHWVPNWAQGYNLPFYYSHIPQILIVGSYRLLNFTRSPLALLQGVTLQKALQQDISLFQYYHWVIYLLMCLFPLSVFLALRVIKLPWLAAGIGAILASQISTDGLYGLDPPSFLFRGWGLSSQLFAMIWLPLAIAYAWNYFKGKSRLFPAVFFLVTTTMGHLGIGYIALLSLLPLGFTKPRKLVLLGSTVLFFLSYWIVPILLTNDYHNVSFWDPVWKFDSFGWRLTMDRLLGGELFDWGRFPWVTLFVLIGVFAAMWHKSEARSTKSETNSNDLNSKSKAVLNFKNSNFDIVSNFDIRYSNFAFLFVFWLLLYFGRTTWGGAIDLIPGMSEFHISRFIVGLHLAGLFLIPIAVSRIISIFPKRFSLFVYLFICIFVYFALYPQTIRYAAHNDFLINQANENYKKVKLDIDNLFVTLKALPPGRVYAGRGGNWGKDFKVAETTYFMHLSTYGLPVVLWLPETWSPNSDVEQYFNEDIASHYSLFGIRYVVTPPSVEPKSFWKPIKETPSWKLYVYTPDVKDVHTSGVYVASGVRPAIVSSSKLNYINVVRLWIQSDAHEKNLYPEITFAKDFPRTTGLPNFKMLDEVTYQVPDKSTHNLFVEPPVYMAPNNSTIQQNNKITVEKEKSDADMIFSAKVTVPENCTECLVILKQSSHPNWRVTVDQKGVQPLTVFPFFVAVPVTEGTHDIVFSYEPSTLKVFLLTVELVTVLGVILKWTLRKKHILPY